MTGRRALGIGHHGAMSKLVADQDLFPAERERDRRRDRKRVTAMVVDGAGIRRQAQALAERARGRTSARERR